MKKIKENLWTDGEQEYTGNPKDGFKPKPALSQDTVVEMEPATLYKPADKPAEEEQDA